MTRHSPALRIALTLLALLAPAGALANGSDQLNLVILGPIGEWLDTRSVTPSAEVREALTEDYADALLSLTDALPSSITVAGGGFAPPAGHETNYGPLLTEIGIEAALLSPGDLARGPAHLERLASAIEAPLLASDLALAEGSGVTLARVLPLDTRASLFASLNPEGITVIPPLAEEMHCDPALLSAAQQSVASQIPIVLDAHLLPFTGDSPVTANEDGTLHLPLPPLRGHEVAICRLALRSDGAHSATYQIVDVLRSDHSPWLTQRASARVRLGGRVERAHLERHIAPLVMFSDYSETRLPPLALEGFPPGISTSGLRVYELSHVGRRTHRLLRVEVDPGSMRHMMTAFVLEDLASAERTLVWYNLPGLEGRATRLRNVIRVLAAEHGLGGLPERPTEARGEWHRYAALREGLSAAAMVLDSLGLDLAENLP